MSDCLVCFTAQKTITSLLGDSEDRDTGLTVSDAFSWLAQFLRPEVGSWHCYVFVQDCSGCDNPKPASEAPATNDPEDGFIEMPSGSGILPSGGLTSWDPCAEPVRFEANNPPAT
jgi:hypothetical protein